MYSVCKGKEREPHKRLKEICLRKQEDRPTRAGEVTQKGIRGDKNYSTLIQKNQEDKCQKDYR